jgi:two-component system chemotaxis response regulator CheB
MIVDDSPTARRFLSDCLARAEGVQVVGAAPDPFIAQAWLAEMNPHVLTLDVEMPRMDGLTFLQRLMEANPLPVVVISSITARGSEAAMRALELGAVEVLCKPGPGVSPADFSATLARAINIAACARPRRGSALGTAPGPSAQQPTPAHGQRIHAPTHGATHAPTHDHPGSHHGPTGAATPATTLHVASTSTTPPLPGGRPASNRMAKSVAAIDRRILAIGASTGGTEAIRLVLERLRAGPGIVIVQHLPPVFTASFAKRLDETCGIRVAEARGGEEIVPGTAWVAPGGHHLTIRRVGGRYLTELSDGPAEHYQRPAVDVCFRSVAEHAGRHAVGVLLTGMGSDGASGLLAMRNAGARTFAQDQASSVVWGMPRAALECGGAEQECPLGDLAERIATTFSGIPA